MYGRPKSLNPPTSLWRFIQSISCASASFTSRNRTSGPCTGSRLSAIDSGKGESRVEAAEAEARGQHGPDISLERRGEKARQRFLRLRIGVRQVDRARCPAAADG